MNPSLPPPGAHNYTLVDTVAMKIGRQGWCTNPDDVPLQAQQGQAVMAGVLLNSVEHEIFRDTDGQIKHRARPAADIAAARKQQADLREAAEIEADMPSRGQIELMKAAGINISAADLVAIRGRLKAKRDAAKGVP